jgi:hypothetical protein
MLRWSSDHKASILIELTEPVTWEEFHRAVHDSHEMVREVDHTVHLLIQVPAQMPDGNPLMHFSGVVKRQPQNLGRVFVIPQLNRANRIFTFAQRLSLIINRVYPGKGHVVFVQSLEQALTLIGEEVTAIDEYEPIALP